MLKPIFVAVVGLIAVIAIGFALTLLDIQMGGVIRTEQAKMDRQVFENTPSYIRGVRSEFEAAMLDTATTNNAAVCGMIKHKFGTLRDVLTEEQQVDLDALSCQSPNGVPFQ